jgi:hypothetical protein
MEELNLTLEQVRDSIRGQLAEGNAGHYRIGQLYNYVVSNKLAEVNGFANAQEYFRRHLRELSQATLSRYGVVARQFTEEACRKYGVVKLNTLRTYADLAPSFPLVPGDPGPLLIGVPTEKVGGAVVPKPFAECTLEELQRAVKYKRRPAGNTLPATDAARVQSLRDSLARAFAQEARVQLKTSLQGGKTLVTVQGVPLEQLERLSEVLREGFQSVHLVQSAG